MDRNAKGSQKALALIKFFSKEEHYLAFKSGLLLLRTPHFYRTCEDPGRGDRSESCLGYWDKGLGHEMPDIVRDGSSMDMTEVKSVLVYPVDEQFDAWLQSWCLIGPYNDFEGSLQRMIDEFGPYFVLLPAEHVESFATLLENTSGAAVRYGLVRYSDNPLERSLTVKDFKYSYQKEFRFFVGECRKGETQDKHIQLEGLDNILSNAQSLKIASPSGVITYCSVGQKKIVTA